MCLFLCVCCGVAWLLCCVLFVLSVWFVFVAVCLSACVVLSVCFCCVVSVWLNVRCLFVFWVACFMCLNVCVVCVSPFCFLLMLCVLFVFAVVVICFVCL